MPRALWAPLLAAGCVGTSAPDPEVGREWLNDISLCDMPAEVQELGDPTWLRPDGTWSHAVGCTWTVPIDRSRIGTVTRKGFCDDGAAQTPAQFLISVAENTARVESDNALMRRMDFTACPELVVPASETKPATDADSGLTGVDQPPSDP